MHREFLHAAPRMVRSRLRQRNAPDLDFMKTKSPKTRTAAAAPGATAHLTTSEQRAIELGGEAEHATGKQRERLTQAAKKLGTKRSD